MSFILLMMISLGLGTNYLHTDLSSFSRQQGSSASFNFPEDDTLRLIGIMAQFPIENPDNPLTSGVGHFLSETVEVYNHYFASTTTPRCDGFLVDRPPHDSLYFKKQLEAVGNYYVDVSDDNLAYTSTIILDKYYQVSHEMEYYAKSDVLLVEFFTEALDSAKSDINDYFTGKEFSADDVVFIVFHAGLSQDFSYPTLDPTIYDLKSAYIDSTMMQEAMIHGLDPAEISNEFIHTGILLPETFNHIYYDVVEDIYYGDENLCGRQLGLTGIFTFFLGYEFGLPPMFNNDPSSAYFGDPAVGSFGLMDQGSINGRGVIPAPPTPWTRIKAGWTTDVINIDSSNPDTILIQAYDVSNQIHKIEISENEYFLIENRNNRVSQSADIATLNEDNWFDTVTDTGGIFIKDNLIEIDSTTGVITAFDHYDYGLPGAGILIWHIKEPDEALYSSGINNNRNNRHVQIEEADGSSDIGFECYHWDPIFCNNLIRGWRYDYWFDGNIEYLRGNPFADYVIFDNESNPNTRTTDNAESFLAIEIIDGISDDMHIRVIRDDSIEIDNLSDEPVHYLGNEYNNDDSTSAVYYEKNGIIYKHSFDSTIDTMDNLEYVEGKLIYTYLDPDPTIGAQIAYTASDTCLNPLCVDEILPLGYINSANDSITVPEALSLGDLDGDGLDEIITIKSGDIYVNNSNGTLVNGFPVNGDYSGVPLIANILGDRKPEIICREESDIVIISNRGEKLRQLSSLDTQQPLAMVPYWDGKMAIVDGSRLFLFVLDMNYSYWLNMHSRPSGFPMSTGTHILQPLGPQAAYNYPNPITEGHTTFRFFIESGSTVNNVQVRIYDAAGFLVKDDLKLNHPQVNLSNEIKWVNIQVDAGLYLAEIKRDDGKSELVRLVVIK